MNMAKHLHNAHRSSGAVKRLEDKVVRNGIGRMDNRELGKYREDPTPETLVSPDEWDALLDNLDTDHDEVRRREKGFGGTADELWERLSSTRWVKRVVARSALQPVEQPKVEGVAN